VLEGSAFILVIS